MCSSCRATKGQVNQKLNTRKQADIIFKNLGYDISGEVPIYIQFHQKHNLPIKKKDK
jgi:hypothetical protein